MPPPRAAAVVFVTAASGMRLHSYPLKGLILLLCLWECLAVTSTVQIEIEQNQVWTVEMKYHLELELCILR